jgi:hypothetical protein
VTALLLAVALALLAAAPAQAGAGDHAAPAPEGTSPSARPAAAKAPRGSPAKAVAEGAGEAWRAGGPSPSEVPAGVFARAAAKRSRTAPPSCAPASFARVAADRCAPAGGAIESVEIDWNAPATNP